MLWPILFILLVALAIGSFVYLVIFRSRKVNNPVRPIITGLVLAVVFGLLAVWAWPNNVSAGGGDNKDNSKQTIDLESFKVCPNGVNVENPTFYVRGTDILSPNAVTPQLPANNPDALIRALFGENGYACQDPVVGVAVSMVQEGLLPFTEREDANEIQDWIALFASNGDAWLQYVSEAAKRFDGIKWNAEWLPEDKDAMFLIADAAQDQALPALKQREDAPPQPWGAYIFLESFNDTPMLMELALVADFGWLALPEGQFGRTPVIEVKDSQPLFPEQPPPPLQVENQAGSGNDQSGGGSGKTSGKGGGNNSNQHNGDQNGCNGVCGTGNTDTGNGQGTGTGGGTGGGCASNCPGVGAPSGPGPSGPCTGNCGGSTPTTSKPTTTHVPPPTTPPPTSPPTTRPPTTLPPPTTAPPPPTTEPPAPPTTKGPDNGCANMPGCTA